MRRRFDPAVVDGTRGTVGFFARIGASIEDGCRKSDEKNDARNRSPSSCSPHAQEHDKTGALEPGADDYLSITSCLAM